MISIVKLIESFNLENPERYLAVLSRYGENILKAPFTSGEFTEEEISKFAGFNLQKEVNFLEIIGILEPDKLKDRVYYSLNEDYEDLSRNTMAYITNEYGGKVFRFVDQFDEDDIEGLSHYNAEI